MREESRGQDGGGGLGKGMEGRCDNAVEDKE